jgi:hypothetical protein
LIILLLLVVVVVAHQEAVELEVTGLPYLVNLQVVERQQNPR